MATIVINVKSKKLKKGDSIPSLQDPSQKCIEVKAGDTIKWKYDNDSDITISANIPFNNQSNNTKLTGKGNTETTVSADAYNDRVISYNIETADTDTELDPVIIVKNKPPFPFNIQNPLVALIFGFALGLVVGYLIG